MGNRAKAPAPVGDGRRRARGAAPLLLAAALALVACGRGGDEGGEPALSRPQKVPPLGDYGGIGGDFQLTDQRGRPFALSQLRGRPAMLFFGYTYCPDICPVTLSKMARVYELLELEPAQMPAVFVSVDPERDTSAKLAQYLEYFAIGAIGLTGTRAQIDAVVRQYGGHYELRRQGDGADYFVDHSTYTYLVDARGKVRFLFRPADGPEFMAAVARQLFAGGT